MEKCKGKAQPRTGHEGPEGGHSSSLSLTSALDGVGGQRHRPAAFRRRKRPGTHFIGGWMGPQGRSGRVRKISPSPGLDHRTFKPVASRYAD